MKSIKRFIFLSLLLALVVIALPNQPAVVTAQEETDLTLYLPMVSSKLSSELPPYSIQMAGLSQITATAAFANLSLEEAAIARELFIAELDETFPTLVEALKQSGAGYVRLYVDWLMIQPDENGAYSWSWYDNRINQLRDAGLGIIATVTNAPTWAIDTTLDPCTYIITEVDAYYQFLEALVDHYPFIKIWEILNEPDAIPGYRCGSGVMNYGFAGAQYATLLQGAYTRIKALDPSATVIMGGMAYDHFVDEDPENDFNRYFLDAFIGAGGAPYMDGVNFHYFHDFVGSWEGWTAGNGDPTCEDVINLDEGGDDTFYYPYGFDITAKASHVAERLRVCHNVTKPQWLTEVGDHGIHPDNIDALDPLRVDDTLENQARYVFTVHARGFASGAENITWYALKIMPEFTEYDHQGLLFDDRDGDLLDNTPKPAYYAYQTMTRELGNYRYEQWVSFDPRTRPAAEAYQFKHMAGAAAGNPKLVAWSNSTSDVPLTLARSSIRVVSRPGNGIFAEELIVADGGAMDADGAVNGSISFNLKLEPVIIELLP